MGILSSLGRLFESTEARDLRRARQVLAREQSELKAAKLRRQRRLIADIPETVAYPQSDWFQPFFDRLSEYQTDPNFYPFGNPSLRKNGNNWPLFQNEQQLDVYRQLSRNVYDGNSHGKGLLTGLRNYVVWKGFTLRATAKKKSQAKYAEVSAIVDRVQMWLDSFIELNDFDEIQQEAFVRSKRDGEYFWRHFPRSDGQTVIRFVWPEHVRQPHGEDQSEWSYGIRCNPGDIETPLQYSLVDPENVSREPEFVGADEIDHVKCNVDRGIKRGMPELCLDMRDILEMSRRLRRNMAEGAAIQAAIAYIRKHGSATASQVNDFAAGQRDYQRPRVTLEGDTARDTEFFESGTILDVDSGQEYIAPPGASNIPGYVEVIQACLRAAGSRWNAPEGLASGDYSNANFASALVAEAPFRRCCETEQAFYERRFKRTVVKAAWHAIAIGALPRDTFAVVEIQVEAPTLEVRNRLEEMQVHQGYNAMGILSPQTITQKIGEDWENEQGNLDAAAARRGPEGSALQLPGEQQQQDDTAGLGALEQWLGGKPLATLEQFALEHGMTGTVTFKDGSKHRYVDGKQVKGEGDAPAVPDLPELPAGTDEKKARSLLGRLWDAVGSKATEIMAKLHGAAPDIFDTAADYSKITYASHGGSALGTPDPFAAHLGLSSNVVAVVASHALSRASMWIRKKLGMSEAVESQLTDQERAALVAEVIAAMHAAIGVDVPAPTAEDVAKWLESRKAD